MHADNEGGFDTWIILNTFPCDKRIVNMIKNGKRIFEKKVFDGNMGKKIRNKIPNSFILDVLWLILIIHSKI